MMLRVLWHPLSSVVYVALVIYIVVMHCHFMGTFVVFLAGGLIYVIFGPCPDRKRGYWDTLSTAEVTFDDRAAFSDHSTPIIVLSHTVDALGPPRNPPCSCVPIQQRSVPQCDGSSAHRAAALPVQTAMRKDGPMRVRRDHGVFASARPQSFEAKKSPCCGRVSNRGSA